MSRVVEGLKRLVEGRVETGRVGVVYWLKFENRVGRIFVVDSLSSSRTLSLSEVGERGVVCKCK